MQTQIHRPNRHRYTVPTCRDTDYIYVYIYRQADTETCRHRSHRPYMQTDTDIDYTHTHTHIYIYIYTHTHTDRQTQTHTDRHSYTDSTCRQSHELPTDFPESLILLPTSRKRTSSSSRTSTRSPGLSSPSSQAVQGTHQKGEKCD